MRRVAFISCLLVLTFFAGAAVAQAPFERQFAADVGLTMPGQPEQHIRLYVGEQRMRMEAPDETDEVVLFELDGDEAVIRVVVPGERMYAHVTMDLTAFIHDDGSDVLYAATAPDDPNHACQTAPDVVSCEHVADEELDGVQVELWEFVFTDQDEVQSLQRVWFDRDREVVVRLEDEAGTVIKFRNHEFGPQPVELFEVPEGYQRVEVPPDAPLPGN